MFHMNTFTTVPDPATARREIVEAIRGQTGTLSSGEESGQTTIDVSALDATLRHARVTQEAIGNMPPAPPTLRGKVGAWLVRVVRRALFWYTAQTAEFGRDILRVIEQQSALIESIAIENANLRRQEQALNAANELRRTVERTRSLEERYAAVVNSLSSLSESVRAQAWALQEVTLLRESVRGAEMGVTDAGARLAGAERGLADAATRLSSVETQAADWMLVKDTAFSTHAGLADTTAQLTEAKQRVLKLEAGIISVKCGIAVQDMRISFLIEQARKRLDQMGLSQLSGIAKEQHHQLDAFYLTFEDHFRGTRDDIKERFRYYLPFC